MYIPPLPPHNNLLPRFAYSHVINTFEKDGKEHKNTFVIIGVHCHLIQVVTPSCFMMRIKRRTIAKGLVLLSVILVMFSLKMLFESGSASVMSAPKGIATDEKRGVAESRTTKQEASSLINGRRGVNQQTRNQTLRFDEQKEHEFLHHQNQRIEFSHRKARQFVLKSESMSSYTSKASTDKTPCLTLGTRFSFFQRCICRKGWLGESCNIPEIVHRSLQQRTNVKLRTRTARRIIYATMFNIEFEMIEAILNEHYELVDVFIFLESSFTAFGSRKPLRLLPKLHRGYLKKFAPKIMYLYLDHFPTGARKAGFKADSYLRGYLGTKGLPNIMNVRDDDLFLVFDTDEIPIPEVIAFLKFNDGYPEPFGVRLRWSLFGFFWKNDRPTQVTIGCTVGMLQTVYRNDSNKIRAIQIGLDPILTPQIESYKESHLVQSWFMGENGNFAGWHCSSCLKPEGIRIKYMSAQNADLPRWGSIPEKMDLNYITSLVQEGRYFDGGKVPESDINSDSFFAPPYILENPDRYKHMLVKPL